MIDKKILEMQAPSTRRCLERPPEDDLQWFLRDIKNWKAIPDAVTMEERVGARVISFKEAQVEQKCRYHRGERLAEIRKEEALTSVVKEKKLSAVNAFMNVFSPEIIKLKFKAFMKDVGLVKEKELARLKDEY